MTRSVMASCAVTAILLSVCVFCTGVEPEPSGTPQSSESEETDAQSSGTEISAEKRNAMIAQATASIPPDNRKTLSPYFFVLSENPDVDQLPLSSTRADVKISGIIADIALTQVYKNTGKTPLEAIYVFPASTKAAVYAMKMTIGKRTIEAKIQKREDAREKYEKALAEGRTASLLEQQRPNVFQMSVGNILQGDQIIVELRYTELLVPDSGQYEFVLPTVVGPRYSNFTETGTAESNRWIQNPHLHAGEKTTITFAAEVRLNGSMPIAALSCPSHNPAIQFKAPSQAEVSLKEGHEGTRDFILRYRLAGDAVQSGVIVAEQNKERYFLAMTQPPESVTPAEIVPREYIFIVDVSGSMQGFPLDISKELMRNLLKDLKASDYFNVLLFAGDSTVLSEKSLAASRANIERAIATIDQQSGGGGTELLPAMKRALALPRIPGTSRINIIATDGFVGVETETFQIIADNLGEANFFPFGIGSSVNRFLIEGMARAGLGEPFVAQNETEARTLAAKLKKVVEAPVLTDIRAVFEGVDSYDVEPINLPDLFAEKPVILFGKIRGPVRGSIVIKGNANGKSFEQRLALETPTRAAGDPGSNALANLWARTRIERLSDLNAIASDKSIESQIAGLGLKHNLLTAFTSFVAIDTVQRGDGKKIVRVKQPLPMPDGVSDSAIGLRSMSIRGSGRGGGGRSGYGRGASALDGLSGSPAPARLSPAASVHQGKKTFGDVDTRSGPTTVQGKLPKETIRRIVHRHINELIYCYEKALVSDVTLTGRLVIRFTIDGTGAVVNSTLAKSTLGNATVERCVVSAVRRWTFPIPEGGGTVQVTYPLTFTPSRTETKRPSSR